jgi:hypothetical protein
MVVNQFTQEGNAWGSQACPVESGAGGPHVGKGSTSVVLKHAIVHIRAIGLVDDLHPVPGL